MDENCLANYADDNTLYAMDEDINTVLNTILNDTNTLDSWFMNNYLLLNNDKCNLLVSLIMTRMSQSHLEMKLLQEKMGKTSWRKS